MRNIGLAVFFVIAGLVFVSPAFTATQDSETSTASESVGIESRDISLAIHPSELANMSNEKTSLLIVDVRTPEEFESARMPGSVNIPLHAIKTKSFLKRKTIVLVNNGDHYSALEREAKNLNDLGFKAKVLVGGLNHWNQTGGRIEGDPFAPRGWKRITPRVFKQQRQYDDWIVMYTGTQSDPDLEVIATEHVFFPWGKKDADTIRWIKKTIGKHKEGSLPFILILDETGESYGQVSEKINQAGIANVFYLDGGMEGLHKYEKNLALIHSSESRKVQSIKNCSSCGN